MPLTSRLAAAEDGLLAAIVAQAALPANPLAGVALRIGDPGSGARPEHVWIVEEASTAQVSDLSSQETPSGGREETFEIMVRVLASRSGDDYVALRNRATALAAEIETAVADNRTLGGAVEDCEVVRIERETGATEVGRAIVTTVVVFARSWLGA
jgi:hypothetical protein